MFSAKSVTPTAKTTSTPRAIPSPLVRNRSLPVKIGLIPSKCRVLVPLPDHELMPSCAVCSSELHTPHLSCQGVLSLLPATNIILATCGMILLMPEVVCIFFNILSLFNMTLWPWRREQQHAYWIPSSWNTYTFFWARRFVSSTKHKWRFGSPSKCFGNPQVPTFSWRCRTYCHRVETCMHWTLWVQEPALYCWLWFPLSISSQMCTLLLSRRPQQCVALP